MGNDYSGFLYFCNLYSDIFSRTDKAVFWPRFGWFCHWINFRIQPEHICSIWTSIRSNRARVFRMDINCLNIWNWKMLIKWAFAGLHVNWICFDKQKKGISAREQIQRKSTKIRQNTGLDIFPRTNGADFCLFTVNGQRVDIHLRQLCQIRC